MKIGSFYNLSQVLSDVANNPVEFPESHINKIIYVMTNLGQKIILYEIGHQYIFDITQKSPLGSTKGHL